MSEPKLSHLDESGRARMVDVGRKPVSERLAIARGEIRMQPATLELIRQVRIRAKERVFVTNALRALAAVSPTSNVRDIAHVVLVGGSALDFEIPQLVTKALAECRVVAGRANIRGSQGPRNAVATGLVLAWEAQR